MSDPTKMQRSENVKTWFFTHAVLSETFRSRSLDRYEAHYDCRQYAHLQHDWWGLNADSLETVSPNIQVPAGYTSPQMEMGVRAKRPTAPFNLCRAVVDRFTGLLFSDQRRPDVSWEGDVDTDTLMQSALESSRFWGKWRQARTLGGAVGSVVVTVHLRNGAFGLEVHNAKQLQVMWKDRRALVPEAILKCYQYIVNEPVVDERTGLMKGLREVVYVYRRLITEMEDIVYKPAKLEDIQSGAGWDVENAVIHGLGFFPGVWVQNMPSLEGEDGVPDCHGVWQNFDTMDRMISQMNKAVLLNLDPTLVLAVDSKQTAAGGLRKGSENALNVGNGGTASYLEIGGSGITVGQTIYELLKKNTLDVVRCIMVDPSSISGAAQSAKAIEYIYAPMLEKADDLRAQYGDQGVVPLLHIMESMVRAYWDQVTTLADGRVVRSKLRLPPRQDGKPHKLGPGGYVRCTWGPYFPATEDDKSKAIANAVSAKTGYAIDSATLVAAIAPLFNVKDIHGMLKKIAAEREEENSMMGPPGYPEDDNSMPPMTDEKNPEAGTGGLG